MKIMVDNCYGEFVETIGIGSGADMVVGPHQRLQRRTCPHRRLHLRHQGVWTGVPTGSPPQDWARGGCQPGSDARPLPGLFLSPRWCPAL
ncbi:MAG: hypothetical protein ACLTYN_11685 [Dysosmobacter welbionis]